MKTPLYNKGKKGGCKMKNTKKTIIIAMSLVLASALALGGCMSLLSEPPEETKEYVSTEMSLPSVIEETPTAQSEMQKKFGAYGKEEIGESGEKIFHLFTEDQIEESMKLREEGERRSLTYEEIVFIINDSIRMYFEYDKIIITDFVCHTHAKPTGALDFDLQMAMNRYDRCEVSSFEYTEIVTYHGDYSDKQSYRSALSTYSTMIYDIEAIIVERLRVHDTGTDNYCLTSHKGDNDHTRIYGILLDGGELTDSEKYFDVLKKNIRRELGPRIENDIEAKYPMLLAYDSYDPDSIRPSIEIYYLEGDNRTKLFPTEQLETLRPNGSLTLSGTTDDRIPRHISFEFDRWTNMVTYTNKNAGFETSMTGVYFIHDDIISLWLGEGEHIYIKIVGEKLRTYDDWPHRDDDKFKEELTFECTSAYNEYFVFPDAFSENQLPITITPALSK